MPSIVSTSIVLEPDAVVALRKYKEWKARARTLGSDKAIAQWREEARSYAVEFANAVLLGNPELARAL